MLWSSTSDGPETPDAEEGAAPREPFAMLRAAAARAASGAPASTDPVIAKLPLLGLRAAAFSLLWITLLVALGFGLGAVRQPSADLLVTGIRVEGTVEMLYENRKGKNRTITVDYHVGSEPWTAEIRRDSEREYAVGDKVTVFYAPGNPERVRTLEEENISEFRQGLLIVPGFFVFAGIPLCLVAAAAWWNRYRSVLKTGWREATATVKPGRVFPEIALNLGRDGIMLLRARRSLRSASRFKGLRNVPVLVGGTGQRMVVVFPRGRWFKERLYPVPVEEVRPEPAL
ncbi:DUF3592 domain-containing protein [Amycolatopsis umgeniensis]